MGEVYGQRPSVWFDVADPDLAMEIDEAAYFIGTQVKALQEATKEVKADRIPKNAPRMVRVPRFTHRQINGVLGFVVIEQTDAAGSETITDELYVELMGGLDGVPPSA